MKKVTVVLTQYLDEKDFKHEDYQEFITSLENGEMSRDLHSNHDSKKRGFRFAKATITHKIENVNGID